MEKTLLIGNGLNRTLRFSISWSELLRDIADEHGVEYISDLPMPLEFERIVNAMLSQRNNQRLRWKTMNLLGQNGLCSAA